MFTASAKAVEFLVRDECAWPDDPKPLVKQIIFDVEVSFLVVLEFSSHSGPPWVERKTARSINGVRGEIKRARPGSDAATPPLKTTNRF